MQEVAAGDIAINLAGRVLFEKIGGIGSTFSDRAASELATQLTNNSMLPSEDVKTYYVRHTGILKTLRKRDLSDAETLELIEKNVFVFAAFRTRTFRS